jgi:YD repeat-containing protein
MKVMVQSLAVVFILSCAAFPAGAGQQIDAGVLKQQLVGSYKLISYVNYDQNGVATKSPYTIGQIMYDAAGRMSAQLMREGRARMRTSQPSEAERAAAYSGYISYFGHYTIDAGKRAVTHHVEGSVSPNGMGGELVRFFEFSSDGKSLFLTVKDGNRVTAKLQWDRYQ